MYKIPDKTVFVGKKIINLPSCESTSTLLISMNGRNKLEEGTILATANQTNGRGQGGNTWMSEPGLNLTFSVLFRPVFLDPSRQFFLNMAVSLAIHDTIKETSGRKIFLKWPNDVLIDGKKVCGILIENQIHGQQLVQSIVGIGLNVNQRMFDVPGATSLCLAAARFLNLAEIFEQLLVNLEIRYEMIRSRDFQVLTRDYHQVLFRKNEVHRYKNGEHIFSGSIRGVDDVGRLEIDVEGSVEKFNFREIIFL